MEILDIDTNKKLVIVEDLERRLSHMTGRDNVSDAMHLVQAHTYAKSSWPSHACVGVVVSSDACPVISSCIRAVVKGAKYMGAPVKLVKRGFAGLIDGAGACFVDMASPDFDPDDSVEICPCPENISYARETRIAANLIEEGISCLVVIGGATSLKVSVELYSDWIGLLRELYVDRIITKKQNLEHHSLHIVNIITSVNHNILGTDYCIGYDTAMHRITEVTDVILSTAYCSGKAFVIEVLSSMMALAAGVVWNASLVICPECVSDADWKKMLIFKVKADLIDKDHNIVVIVSDGMKDINGISVTSRDVAACLHDILGLDARVTVLGDIQRGGNPSVFDRIHAIRSGIEAVNNLQLQLHEKSEPMTVCITGQKMVCYSTSGLLDVCELYRQHLHHRDYTEMTKLRCERFQQLLTTYRVMQRMVPAPIFSVAMSDRLCRRIGVLHVGHMILGLMDLVKWIAKDNASKGFLTVGYKNGFEGLVKDKVVALDWSCVANFSYETTHLLSFSELTAGEIQLEEIGQAIIRNRLSGLIVIGDFKAFRSVNNIWRGRSAHKGLLIPMCYVPASIKHNIPGTHNTLGFDNVAKSTLDFVDKVKCLARGSQNIVFVVETPPDAYLTTVSALCATADILYTPDKKCDLDTMLKDAKFLRNKIENTGQKYGVIVHSSEANPNYPTNIIHKIFAEEGKGVYSCKTCVFDTQMGFVPTYRFRILCKLFGIQASDWVTGQVDVNTQPDGTISSQSSWSKCALCCRGFKVEFKSIQSLAAETDFDKEQPTFVWWSYMNALHIITSSNYETEELSDIGKIGDAID